jgi:hypothetical protein
MPSATRARLVASLSLLAALICAPAEVAAHGTFLYISAPFAPPANWGWVSLLYIILQFAWIGWYFREEDRQISKYTNFAFCLFLSMFIALAIGVVNSGLSTAPPPGFTIGARPFYGYGWSRVGTEFLFWNTIGMAVLLVFMFIFVWNFRLEVCDSHHFIIGSVVVYLLCLLPFILGGALTGGRHGSYVQSRCESNMEVIMQATWLYSKEHNEKLPDAKNIEELKKQLRPYMNFHQFYQSDEAWFCPFELSYETNPQPFKWDFSLAGKNISDLPKTNLTSVALRCCYQHTNFYRNHYKSNFYPAICFWEAKNFSEKLNEDGQKHLSSAFFLYNTQDFDSWRQKPTYYFYRPEKILP